jgi:RHS repeat-associated protein
MSIDLRRLLAVSAVLAVICAPSAAGHGRTMGAFNVSGGAATYTIPIWTPPGPNGMTPTIALTYNSAAGNGIAGMGWNLAAVSSIERCARTNFQDVGAPIGLNWDDRFCMDGSRLRLVSGTYGSAGSIYHTEIADFSRVTAYGVEGLGPRYFIVEGKNGLKYEYGNTVDSRVAPSTTVLRWMLNKVSDRNGNNYIVSYNNNLSFAVPDTISWTPTSHGSSSYRYQAKFNYTNTRTDIDSIQARVLAITLINRYRLESIQIKSGGAVRRKYSLSYDLSSVTSRTRLRSVRECSDDAETSCLLPLSFNYQAGMGGVTAGAIAAPPGSSNNVIRGNHDFNGDGKSDLVYWAGSWHVAFGADVGFSTPVNTGVTVPVLVDRFLATGRSGLVGVSGGLLYSHYWNEATSTFVASASAPSSTQPTTSMDFDGDGMADLVYFSSGSTSITVRRNVSTGAGGISFSGSFPTGALTGNLAYGTFQNPGNGGYSSDINGDGREDASVQIVNTGMGGGFTRTTLIYGSVSGFDVPPQAQWVNGTPPYGATLNFNGDKCADRILSLSVQISACFGMGATSVTLPAAPKVFMDWDGDGKQDLLVDNGGTMGVYRSTGTGFTGLASTSITSTGTFFPIDQDGDRQDDLIQVNGTSAINYWTHTQSGQVPSTYATNISDLLSNVTDGFGISHSPNYVSTAWSHYDKGATTPYPLKESEPRIVVAKVTTSNGIGGTYDKTYGYVGARTQAEDDAFRGFQRIDAVDSRNGLIERHYFEQTFPVAGMVSQHEIMQPNGVTPIAKTVFNNGFTTLNANPGTQRYFVFQEDSTATQFEVGGTWNGSLLRTVTTTNSFHSASGTLYDQTVTTTEPASGANGVNAGGSWTTRTHSPTANFWHDEVNWCLGRPGRTETTNSHNLTYGDPLTRTTTVDWNTTLCRPTQTVDEPGSGTLQIVTGIGYDNFGNVNSTSVTGIGMPVRTTSIVYADATFTTGQFPLSVTNALGQTSYTAWQYDLAVPTSVTDANGLTTSWQYDNFARRNRENRPDGTATTWTINACASISGGCVGSNNKTTVVETALNTSFAYVNDALTYLDALDRPIITSTRVVSGAYNRVDREYDALGRVHRESAPCIWSSCSTFWVTNSYDLANRPTQVSRPKTDVDSTLQSSTVTYLGLTTRITDALGMTSEKVVNGAGQLVRSRDHDGYYQSFQYDAFGGPKRVQDSAGNTLQQSTFNSRGMLTALTDMDMGAWSFTPNALGEVVSQTDAKGQTTTFGFDLLGRLTSRIEAEGTSTWTWGTSSSDKNIGSLSSVSGPGYSETYVYDSLGRPSSTTVSADTTYLIAYTYNNIGALDTIKYPVSTNSYRLKLQYDYQWGQLYRVRDFLNLATHFWTAGGTNARNQITQETLANGLVTNRSYDAVTGWLKSIQTGLSGGTGVQNLAYRWDLVGNLKERKDANQSNLTETFYYDNLHRLDYSTLTGVSGNNIDLAYDALGNITSKSDVGTYTYHPTKKHQVTSTSNGWSFGYDANGNMTSGRGSTITWTSFNYPASIANGSNTSSFSYTPDRQYWRQISNYASGGSATTIYVGGIMEKVTTSAGTDYRHLIRAGGSTIIVSRQTSGTNSVHYVTSDHLGSSSAVTNSSGGILVNSSFDAFGKRRGANWTGSPSSGDWAAIASTTRRGYTDHTMLDNLGLVHMNGRVQDPLLGRFASADPFITEPGFTQNFNRYSYVYNNPLRFVDPSGFCGSDSGEQESKDSNGDGVPDNSGRQDGSVSATSAATCMQEVVVRAFQCGAECMRRLVMQWNAYIDSLNPRPDLGPVTHRQEGFVCYATGCVRGDGRFSPYEPGLDSVSWFEPITLGVAAGLEELGCAGDCQVAVTLIGAVVSRSPSAARGALPANARTTIHPQEVYRRLEKFHGIDPAKAGDRLHDIKKSAGLGPADNVVFDLTGNVYDKGGNWLGSLTMGGG